MSVQKYKVSKNEGNFTTFPNRVLQNLRDIEALGLYCFLLSLPNGWEFHKNHLRKHAKVGINKLNSLLAILEDHALVKTVQIRSEKGRFAHFDLQVNDGTAFVYKEEPEKCAPFTENRDTDNRATVNSIYKRKSVENKEDTKEIPNNNSASSEAHAPQADAFNEFWNVYPIKKNKIRAKLIWDRKCLNLCAERIINDVCHRLVNDGQWQEMQFIPHASTYLQNDRWHDELTPIKKAKSNKGNASDALSRVINKHMNKEKVYDHDSGNTIDPLR